MARKSVEFSRQVGVKAYIPTPAQIAAAEDRTAGMVAMYVRHGAKTEDLCTLVRSAYLQGVWDAGCAMAMIGKAEGNDGSQI